MCTRLKIMAPLIAVCPSKSVLIGFASLAPSSLHWRLGRVKLLFKIRQILETKFH